MNKKFLYKTLIKDISNVIKKHLNESNTKIVDKEINVEFDINDIPLSALCKQYINFNDYLMPRFYDKLTNHERINEDIKYSASADTAIAAIIDRYPIAKWQIIQGYNKINVIFIIPLIEDNEYLITNSMKYLGYYVSNRWLQPVTNENGEKLKYIALRFDPYYPASITNDIRQYDYIYHISPAYNLESIKKMGLFLN